MKGNTEEDILKQDNFNEFMLSRKLFIKDITGQISMNPNKVMQGNKGAEYEYTMAQGLIDYKKYSGK